MTWIKLKQRINNLPLVLAGPILRRVDSQSTTVWIALREPRKITLRVFSISLDAPQLMMQEGTRSTVKFGEHLHVVALTAVGNLEWGKLYGYDLRFGQEGNDTVPIDQNGAGLFDIDILAQTAEEARKLILYSDNEVGVSMTALELPSFATPPVDLNHLRIIHGSCRKPHGYSQDAFPTLDSIIRDSLSDPLKRPHQLFLTGDQIYADDVADGLLAMLTDNGDTLLGWVEQLPTRNGIKTPSDLKPGRRQDIIKKSAIMSSKEAKSHLISLGEFYSMYLHAWSLVCWPPELPEYMEVNGIEGVNEPLAKSIIAYSNEMKRIAAFKAGLPFVRRALANIPTYMIFDDHEITDDWYIDRKWCEDVLDAPLGRRIISNGLLAYSIFQAWGNTPEQFAPQGTIAGPGRMLFEAASQWNGTDPHPSVGPIYACLGINRSIDVRNAKKLVHPAGSLDWHYHLPAVPGGPPYEVIVLDSRTLRGYPQGRKAAAALICDENVMNSQLAFSTAAPADGLTIVIAPGPVIGVPLVEEKVQASFIARNSNKIARTVDREAWSHQRKVFEMLIGRLVVRNSRVVFLSGDVHYGFSAHVSFWAQHPFGSTPSSVASVLHKAVFAQLTASSLKNESASPPTYYLHDNGYIPILKELPMPVNISGWLTGPVKVYHSSGTNPVPGNPPIFYTDTVDQTTPYSAQPDWRYRVDYLLSEKRLATPAAIPLPANWDTASSMNAYLSTNEEYRKYLEDYAPGKEIVGLNNIGEVTLNWNSNDDRSVTHQLWWRLTQTSQPFPISKFIVHLQLDDPKYPEPAPLPVLSN